MAGITNMTTYTKVTKPSSTAYTNINTTGREQYDQSDITYDSAIVFYDGVNQSQYTKINKPSSTTYTKVTKPT